MAENSMRDAILSVVEAKGGSTEGVGPLDRDALDRLLDVMAGSDQPVTSGMSDAQVVRALAQYAHGGGGGAQTLDVNIWNNTEDESLASVLPAVVRYVVGVSEGVNVPSDPLPFEHITSEAYGTTLHGVRVSGMPVGAFAMVTLDNATEASLDYLEFGLTESGAADESLNPSSSGAVVLAPVGGLVVTGRYNVISGDIS